MAPIDAISMSIFMFEGARLADPTVRCVRDNNPGNLRPLNAGQPNEQNYRTFDTFAAGWTALQADITYKLKHHLKPNQTMVDLFNLYAPGADHNDPRGYAQFVCRWMSGALKTVITVQTKLVEVFECADFSQP